MKKQYGNFIAAFDFDGVIWDTVNECFYVGNRAYGNLFGKISADEKHLEEQFRQGRYLAKSGNDFYILFHLMARNPDVDFSKVSFEEFYSNRDKLKDDIGKFTGEFYRLRSGIINRDFDFWRSLQGPFPGMTGQLPVIKDHFRELVICSAKDAGSIKKLLAHYGQNYPVYGREISIYKPDLMRGIMRDYGVEAGEIVFVDDLLENLLDVGKMGVHTLMADWGYNNEGERAKARDAGIKIISKENIVDQMLKFLQYSREFNLPL